MKDPAFLFYSKDFYEGTRTMLPEERACYVDLLIYQHQHGALPSNIKRLALYCSGIDEATLKAVLEAKFELCDKGYINKKLETIINDRIEFSSKQSDNGIIGQFFKKAKSTLKAGIYNDLRDFIHEKYGRENLLLELKKNETSHEAMLEAMLKHLAIVNANGIANANEDVIGNSFEKGAGKTFKAHKFTEQVKQIFLTTYSELFTGQQYTLANFDDRSISSISYQLQEKMVSKAMPVTSDTISQFSKAVFMSAWHDKWLQRNYTISNIEKNINNILNKAHKSYEQHNYIPSWDRD